MCHSCKSITKSLLLPSNFLFEFDQFPIEKYSFDFSLESIHKVPDNFYQKILIFIITGDTAIFIYYDFPN